MAVREMLNMNLLKNVYHALSMVKKKPYSAVQTRRLQYAKLTVEH